MRQKLHLMALERGRSTGSRCGGRGHREGAGEGRRQGGIAGSSGEHWDDHGVWKNERKKVGGASKAYPGASGDDSAAGNSLQRWINSGVASSKLGGGAELSHVVLG
jgi:hypothetical protein